MAKVTPRMIYEAMAAVSRKMRPDHPVPPIDEMPPELVEFNKELAEELNKRIAS